MSLSYSYMFYDFGVVFFKSYMFRKKRKGFHKWFHLEVLKWKLEEKVADFQFIVH